MILIWLIIFGAGMFLSNIAFKSKNIESKYIATESNTESSEEDDLDDGIIYCFQLQFHQALNKSFKSHSFQPTKGHIFRALKPPRALNNCI